jgi:hypothetical protein
VKGELGSQEYLEIRVDRTTYRLTKECAEKRGVSVDKVAEEAVRKMLEKLVPTC